MKAMTQVRNIKSLQVFAETYRVGNVTRSAEELNISQSSVSYHIKKLETDLGTSLFRRTASGLEPTEDGAVLFKHVDRGFAIIRNGVQQAANRAGNVRVALLPMFASRWLSHRLGDLLETHPEITLSILNHNNSYAYSNHPEDFADIGVQWGLGKWHNFHAERLWQERLVAVCSPDYRDAMNITDPGDLHRCTLIHVDDTRMWNSWFEHHGRTLQADHSKMLLEDRHFQLSSTINGLGISLFAEWLVASELQSGALINPFGGSISTDFAYFAITPKTNEMRTPVLMFLDWLISESKSEGENAVSLDHQFRNPRAKPLE